VSENYQIIENFMPEQYCSELAELLGGLDFPWFNYNIMVNPYFESEFPFFAHMVYFDNQPNSQYFSAFKPLVEKLEARALLRIRANNFPRHHKIVEHGYHDDYEDPEVKTAVYYPNTNNGSTILENGVKVDSVANRLLLMNTAIKHTSTSHTDAKYRYSVIINFL
jgi:hypothetical protein